MQKAVSNKRKTEKLSQLFLSFLDQLFNNITNECARVVVQLTSLFNYADLEEMLLVG